MADHAYLVILGAPESTVLKAFQAGRHVGLQWRNTVDVLDAKRIKIARTDIIGDPLVWDIIAELPVEDTSYIDTTVDGKGSWDYRVIYESGDAADMSGDNDITVSNGSSVIFD